MEIIHILSGLIDEEGILEDLENILFDEDRSDVDMNEVSEDITAFFNTFRGEVEGVVNGVMGER